MGRSRGQFATLEVEPHDQLPPLEIGSPRVKLRPAKEQESTKLKCRKARRASPVAQMLSHVRPAGIITTQTRISRTHPCNELVWLMRSTATLSFRQWCHSGPQQRHPTKQASLMTIFTWEAQRARAHVKMKRESKAENAQRMLTRP